MKVYISSHSTRLAQEAADIFVQAGYEVVSVWHDGSPAPPLAAQHAWLAKDKVNQDCILNADVFVSLSTTLTFDGEVMAVPGGKFFEAGFAYAKGKRVVLVGGPENGAFWSEGIVHVQDTESLLTLLKPA